MDGKSWGETEPIRTQENMRFENCETIFLLKQQKMKVCFFFGGFGRTQLRFGKFLKVIGYLIENPHETDDFGDFVDL